MKNTNSICAVVFSAVCLMLTFPVYAAAGENSGISYGTVPVGIFSGPGYAEENPQGKWGGIDIELIENIAQTAGFRVVFIEEPSANKGFQDLIDGTISMLADIAKTPEREQKYLFSEYEQGTVGTSIFVRTDDDLWDYGNAEQIKTMKFTCERNNIAETDFRTWCSQYGFSPDITAYDTSAMASDAVLNKKADAFIDGEDVLKGFRSILSFAPSPYYLVFSKNSRELKSKVDAAMAQIFMQEPLYEKELFEKYIGLTPGRTLAFTQEEKAYIAAHPEKKIAVLKNDEPFFYGTEAAPAGIIPEFYEKISAATGIHFSYTIYNTQQEAVAAVTAGKADLIGMFSDGLIQAYDSGLSVSRKYTSVNTVMILKAGTDAAVVRKIAVKERSREVIFDALPETLKNVELVACNTAGSCFKALTEDKVDAVILGMTSATYLINQTNSSAYVIAPITSLNLELCAAAVRGNQTLIAVLNKGINVASYAISGIIANNTVSKSSFRTAFAKIPPSAVILFSGILLLLVMCLTWAVFAIAKSRKTKLAAANMEAKATEQRIRAEAAEKNVEEKTAFFSNISHDMRTPLNAVLGFVRQAEKKNISPEQRTEYLAKVELAGNLLLDLINDTLTVSKISSGKLTLQLSPCWTRELADAVTSSVCSLAEKKGVAMSVDISSMPDRIIMADRLNIEKIFLNLLSNAIKYTPSGGHVWFTIKEESQSGNLLQYTVTVKDDGIGMSEEYLPHVFEPFSQERQPGYESVGTGLGLSIVKQLVDLMGGSIEIQSCRGRGSTFTLCLHFEEGRLQDIPQPVSVQKADTDMTGTKVLLCEDNVLNREIAAVLLKDRGIIVDTAENGSAGVQKFSSSTEGEYVCILMDVRMPVMDGLEATKVIRNLKRPDAGTIPIIAMTANAFPDDVQDCLKAGMNGHIAKPIAPEQMFNEIQNAIR